MKPILATGRDGGSPSGPAGLNGLRPLDGIEQPLFTSEPADATGAWIWYYAPGYLAIAARGRSEDFERDLRSEIPSHPHAAALRRHAAEARRLQAEMLAEPYAPVCLTVYPSNDCNAACTYCYSVSDPAMQARARGPRITLGEVQAAADMVAANCRTHGLPFTLVLHGGGEPTLDRRLAGGILRAAEASAAAAGVVPFRYVATNGVMPASRARWLAGHFDLIGLSCDGPEWIQSRQRPLPGGRTSSAIVERTARIVRDAGRPLAVRVTLTPESSAHQSEIADYVCSRLGPREIHVEPAYRQGWGAAFDGRATFRAEDADAFAAGFLGARAVARGYGIDWRTSGVRPAEVHGPYCQVFRNVFQIVPGSVASACFGVVDAAQARRLGLDVAVWEAGRHCYRVDEARVAALRRVLGTLPPACRSCFNRFHCSGACPDVCPGRSSPAPESFRCRLERLLALAYLRETAARLEADGQDGSPIRGGPVDPAIQPAVAR